MRAPYTDHVDLATTIASVAAAVAMTAVIAYGPTPSRTRRSLLLGATLLAAAVPAFQALSGAGGVSMRTATIHVSLWLAWTAEVLFVVLGEKGVSVGGLLLAQSALAVLGFRFAGTTVAAIHLTWCGVLAGLDRTMPAPSSPTIARNVRARMREDVAWLLSATVLAAVVCVFVFERFPNTGDDWGYVFQADLFAHFKAYVSTPPCAAASGAAWVFDHAGRRFAEYTPGWPLFMAPFSRLGVVWMANPVALGLLTVGVARLARRALEGGRPEAEVRCAGRIAAFVTMTCASMLLTAASQYSHVFVSAMFVWSVEALCALTAPAVDARRARVAALALGVSGALLAAARPVDGALLGLGLGGYLVFAIRRGRLSWRGAGWIAATFVPIAVLSLVILRVQVGTWFTTGYSLAAQTYHGAKFAVLHLSLPSWGDLPKALPLASGSYCWWPCAPALGAFGLLRIPRGGRHIAFMLGVGAAAIFAFYFLVEYNRYAEWGYGPRYFLVGVTAMAVGTGVLLAPIVTAPAWGPRVAVFGAMCVGPLALVPLLYLPVAREVHEDSAVQRAIAREGLQHALVFVGRGHVAADPWNLTQNRMGEATPDVLVLRADVPLEDGRKCVERAYPGRQSYAAFGRSEARLMPLPPVADGRLGLR